MQSHSTTYFPTIFSMLLICCLLTSCDPSKDIQQQAEVLSKTAAAEAASLAQTKVADLEATALAMKDTVVANAATSVAESIATNIPVPTSLPEQPIPTVGAENPHARQIRFSVHGGTFTYLKIVGENQMGQVTTWETGDSQHELFFADTKDYWWQGTMVLQFNTVKFGPRTCVIDYLKEPTNSNMVPVMYTEGQGCSGDSGSAGGVYKGEVEILYQVLFSEEDSLKLVGVLETANNSLECVQEIANGLATNGIVGKTMKIIKVTTSCGGVALDRVNDILKKYSNQVEF